MIAFSPKESTKKCLELISEFRRAKGVRATHKNQLYFYILTIKTWKPKLKLQRHL